MSIKSNTDYFSKVFFNQKYIKIIFVIFKKLLENIKKKLIFFKIFWNKKYGYKTQAWIAAFW
jgi:hypothetical protein